MISQPAVGTPLQVQGPFAILQYTFLRAQTLTGLPSLTDDVGIT